MTKENKTSFFWPIPLFNHPYAPILLLKLEVFNLKNAGLKLKDLDERTKGVRRRRKKQQLKLCRQSGEGGMECIVLLAGCKRVLRWTLRAM